MSNAVCSKTMENVRNKIDLKLFSLWEENYSKRISQPSYKQQKIFDNDLFAM